MSTYSTGGVQYNQRTFATPLGAALPTLKATHRVQTICPQSYLPPLRSARQGASCLCADKSFSTVTRIIQRSGLPPPLPGYFITSSLASVREQQIVFLLKEFSRAHESKLIRVDPHMNQDTRRVTKRNSRCPFEMLKERILAACLPHQRHTCSRPDR